MNLSAPATTLRPTFNLPRRLAQAALLATPLFVGLSGAAHAGFTVFQAGGDTPASITAARDDFRSAVGGGTTGAANGNFGNLRREINWDGVPDIRADSNLLPADFFNTTSPRGAVFSTPGTGFLVSANAGQPTSTLFGFPIDLQAFSAQRLFAPIGSGTMDVTFFVPGTTTAATTSAFGAVFADVDYVNLNEATTMEFFNTSNALIFSSTVLSTNNHGLSFLGGVANAGERISRVRITTPGNFLVSNGVRNNELADFVVMDDFLYASPLAVPEPETWAMILAGLALVGWRSRSRKPA